MKVSAPSPDPGLGKAAEQNSAIAGRMADLAELQYGDQKKLLDEYGPMLKEMLASTLSDQQTTRDRADAQWQSYNDTWKPLEDAYAKKAAEFDTPERRNAAAEAAASEVGSQFDTMRTSAERDMAAAGLDPSAIQTLGAASRINEATAKAGAANKARTDTEMAGLGLLESGARFGRNMPSTGLAASQLATSQGGAAQSQYQGLTSATNAPGAAAGSLYSGAIQGNQSAGNLYTQQFNAQNSAMNSQNSLFGDVLGAGLKAYGMGMFGSSKKTKRMGPAVRDGLEAVSKSPAKKWRYKPGEGDGNQKQRMGPTAESLNKVAPEVSDGKVVDGIALAGLHHAALGDVAKRLGRIEKKLGLADARRG